MKREPLFYLEIMLDYCNRSISYLNGISLEQFITNREKQDSISHVLYRLAEASVQLDEQFKNKYKEINWKDINGLRVLLAHIYHNIDFSILYDISVKAIPSLRDSLQKITNEIKI